MSEIEEKTSIKNTVKNYVPRINTTILVLMGLMVAIQIILERFLPVIDTGISRLSFTFIGRAVCGAVLGPLYGALVGLSADVLGWFMKQTFAFNPGITFAAAFRGVVFGIFLFRKQSVGRMIAAAFGDQFIAGLVITTLSLFWFGGIPITWATLSVRLIQCSVIFVVEVAFLLLTRKNLFAQIKKYLSVQNREDRI